MLELSVSIISVKNINKIGSKSVTNLLKCLMVVSPPYIFLLFYQVTKHQFQLFSYLAIKDDENVSSASKCRTTVMLGMEKYVTAR